MQQPDHLGTSNGNRTFLQQDRNYNNFNLPFRMQDIQPNNSEMMRPGTQGQAGQYRRGQRNTNMFEYMSQDQYRAGTIGFSSTGM